MSARALLLVAGLSTPAFGQFRDWQTGNGLWSANFSWSPIGVPAPADIARIGIHAGAANSTVSLDQSDTVGGLQITDGMTLDLGGSQLIVSGPTLISGSNSPGKSYYRSTIMVEPGLAAWELQTGNLSIEDDGYFLIVDGAVARVDGEMTIDAVSAARGEGAINFTSNGVRAFNNNGQIGPWGDGLTLNQQGAAELDLDGTAGTGRLMLNVLSDITLHVHGTELSDPFSGELHMAAGCALDMDLDSPWEADAGSEITAYSFSNSYPQGMRIEGSPVVLSGQVALTGGTAILRVLADAEVNATANFDLQAGSLLRFESDTDINGGAFTSSSNDFADGGITFAGPTRWSGTTTIDGAARQNGNATVLSATVINAGEIDLDGGGGVSPSTWTINHALTINAERVDQSDGTNNSGRFDGTMNISGGFLAGLTVNIEPPGWYWQMNGTLNLTGDPLFYMSRVAGSHMAVTGDVNVVSGRVQLSGSVSLNTNADITIPANAILRCGADSVVYDAEFFGVGTLQNGPDGVMVLSDNVDTDDVGLVNEGELEISGHHVLAMVDRFSQTAGGELIVSIGGYSPGVEHDLLIATDGAVQLDGLITVDMTEFAQPQFYPQPGDEFVIITSDDGVVGSFDAHPVTRVEDLTFQWVVEYHPFDVTLHLQSVAPDCPGDANGDGLVNGADLSVLLSQYGQNIEQWSESDLNGDGWVQGNDLSVLLSNYGNVCAVQTGAV